jgi:hypothetical protein
MVRVAKFVMGVMAAAALAGASTHVHAQMADDDLRLDTDVAVDADAPPATVPPLSRITLGDDEEAPVRRRRVAEDPYAQQGIRSGAFLLLPSLETGAVWSSNVRHANSNARSDVGLRIKPQLRFESDWVRHSLTGTVSLEGQQYVRDDDIRSLNGSADAQLRLDFAQGLRGEIDVNYSATSTGLESSELPATATGSRLDHAMGASVAAIQNFGQLDGTLRLGMERNIFGDVKLTGGGKEDNSDRNFTALTLSARVALANGGKLQPYAEVAYVPRIYDKARDRNGEKRTSQGLRLSAGLTFADDPIWTGDVAANLELRDYSDAALGTVLNPGIAANVTWRPTDLTRFEFNAGASLEETVSAGISAEKNWSFGAKAIHNLQENVEVYAGLRGVFERSGGKTDVTTTASAGVDWTLNPMVVVGAGYEGTFFNADAANADYTDHRILARIILRR